MKKIFIAFTTLLLLIAFSAISTYAQEWTKEQKEVWATVEANWNAWKAGNVDKLMASMHDQYVGWSDETPLPMDKPMVEKFFRKYMAMSADMDFEIMPARIAVVDNAAVVHYYFSYTFAYGEPKSKVSNKGKYVEFYVKKGTAWLLIGDFTHHEAEKK